MTPDVYVSSDDRNHGISIGPWVFSLAGGTTSQLYYVWVTEGTDSAAATATCDFLARLLATCDKRDAYSEGIDMAVPPPLSGAGLSIFFQESRETLQKLTLCHMVLNEDQCLALAAMSRLDVELVMYDCFLMDNAAVAFFEYLQSDRGPIQLDQCRIDSQILANALIGDSRVTRFRSDPWVTIAGRHDGTKHRLTDH
jgi:hypothetical protein